MKNLLVLLFLLNTANHLCSQQILSSPSKDITLSISNTQPLMMTLTLKGTTLLKNIEADLLFGGKSILATNKPSFKKTSNNSNVTIEPSFKHHIAKDEYNQLTVQFDISTAIEIRAYNEGIAYRFVTSKKGEVEVNETFNLQFADNYSMYASLLKKFESSYEEPYKKIKMSDFPNKQINYMPLLLDANNGNKIYICDADIQDYPHLFLEKGDSNQLKGVFPTYPLETKMVGDRASEITNRASYIAKTKANRKFPWRAILLTSDDRQLLETDLFYLLAEPGTRSAAWVKPGRVAWDWWNASNIYHVDFKAGLNTQTWKYYMDFAAHNGLEYLILDEGWSISTTDISAPNKDLDLQELIRHGKEVNVKLILWTTWRALLKDWTILDKFKEWGIAGIKVDFMDRADQPIVNFYEKAAEETYKRELMIDFHGAFKPSGLRRQYPNIVAYEGICGLEQNKWSKRSNPKNNTLIPFIRMIPGPMDYTPGAMRNYHEAEYTPNYARPGSMGTRCQQVGIFIIYETGLQMLADSPSNYESEKETFDFLKQIPVVWDETKALEAKAGEYIVIARKHGQDWFVGGMTSDSTHTAHIDFSFLEEGNYSATIMQDGVNVQTFAEDYTILKQEINKNTVLDINMYKGGGLGIILRKK